MTPEPSDRPIRRLARSVEAIHTVTYYSAEIARLTDEGFRGWWHAYFAYRAAPLGPVDLPVVAAAFYNFAPRMVARAIPGVWDVMSPNRVLERRRELVTDALDRIWGDGRLGSTLGEAESLAREALVAIETGARPLAAAHAALEWPDHSPAVDLWHACTIWREYRGDAHNIALAAAGIDGLESHVLMAAHGRGNQATITGIRGWTAQEWSDAVGRLAARGIVDPEGAYTDAGRGLRSTIEATTDELCARPVETLGPSRTGRLVELLGDVSADLLASGAVPGVWPPPNVVKGDAVQGDVAKDDVAKDDVAKDDAVERDVASGG